MTRSCESHITTDSAAATRALGERLGKAARAGDVIALIGDLGSGKTVLTKGLAVGVGCDPNQALSPTFVLMRQYEGRLTLNHFDAYRLAGPDDMIAIGAEEIFFGNGLSAVEWADRVMETLPADRLEIHMSVVGEENRKVRLVATGAASRELMARANLSAS